MLTLGRHLAALVAVASAPLGGGFASTVAEGPMGAELSRLLTARNGFHAFESSLHVFHAGEIGALGSLQDWNAAETWRHAYRGLADGLVFFAEDVFGGQFGLRDDGVFAFNPETGDLESMGSSLEEWASRLLDDLEMRTGYPLAHEWQVRFGALPAGQRLVPKTPFVLGGTFGVDNLLAMDAATGMRLRGELAVQIRDLPDGAQVRYAVVD